MKAGLECGDATAIQKLNLSTILSGGSLIPLPRAG
jgi:hypothetical protein